jgi:hypothetical protein
MTNAWRNSHERWTSAWRNSYERCTSVIVPNPVLQIPLSRIGGQTGMGRKWELSCCTLLEHVLAAHIEGIAQAVADKVDADDRQADGNAGHKP